MISLPVNGRPAAHDANECAHPLQEKASSVKDDCQSFSLRQSHKQSHIPLHSAPRQTAMPSTNGSTLPLRAQFSSGEEASGSLLSAAADGYTTSNGVSKTASTGGERQPPTWHGIVWRLAANTPVGRALVSAARRLRGLGFETPQLDAQVILAHVLGVDRAWLFAHHDHELNSNELDSFTTLITRHMNDEPVAYLVGRQEFYGIEIQVDERTLIPRPETELLVDAVLSQIEMLGERAVTVADVGTGSGAIAIAVATNAPHALIYGVDLSADALQVASENVWRTDLEDRVQLLRGDLLAPLACPVDIVVANLPYISQNDYRNLDRTVRNFEPKLALEAGPEGLDAIARLLRQASAKLKPAGAIFLEIGCDQGQAVLALVDESLPQARYVDLRQDYNGRDRIVAIVL